MMYSNKENVNILTALMVKWGVRHAVVCPGSRNAPIVHNLNECPDIQCYPVTDERSAAFFALGVSQVEDEPVIVCVTSGTALLNVAPAVAEAFYQHRRLIVISADRPAALIDQLQGQTMPQPGALTTFVRKAVDLPEPHDDTEHWYCNRLVNEAMIESVRGDGGPVHINVPISEPLFDFSVPSLPEERMVSFHGNESNLEGLTAIADDFKKAKRPMILIGQTKPENLVECDDDLMALDEYAVLFDEKLGNDMISEPQCIDEMLIAIEEEEEDYLPDFIVYLGDTFVSRRLKEFLRKAKGARVVIVNGDGVLRDVFMNATDVLQASIPDTLATLANTVRDKKATPYRRKWETVAHACYDRAFTYEPAYSQMLAVQELCFSVSELNCEFHYANSSAVRLGLHYSDQYMYVNRGMNGIEGCLSTAVGFACVIDAVVFCVIGDLSFFYDQNALWNNNLTSNLRILLLNNGCGGIFRSLPGLKESAACENLVAASHETTAEGICMENGVKYIAAHNEAELHEGIMQLVVADSLQPILLEVFTDAKEDDRVVQDYFYGEKKQMN